MASPARRLTTYADMDAVPEHLVAKIIDGTLEIHPVPPPLHASAAAALSSVLVSTFAGRGGWLLSWRPRLHLGPQVAVPDLAGWHSSRMPEDPGAAFVVTPPDWVCEVLSPATVRIDRGPKRRLYAEGGVSHLWLLDPMEGYLEAFSLAGRYWLPNDTAVLGETVSLPPFDAIAFPHDDLFAFDDPAASGQPES